MTQGLLDDPDAVAVFEQTGGEAAPDCAHLSCVGVDHTAERVKTINPAMGAE